MVQYGEWDSSSSLLYSYAILSVNLYGFISVYILELLKNTVALLTWLTWFDTVTFHSML